MPLPTLTRQLVEKRLGAFCARKIPPYGRDQVRLGYKVRGNNVTLFEERPIFPKPGEWMDIPIAQFRFSAESGKWTLYCADRNSRWHEYCDLKSNADLDILLKEVDDDPTCIFWG